MSNLRSLEDLEFYNVSKPHVIDIISPRSDKFFRQEMKLLIDLICGGAKTRPQPLNMKQSEAVTVSLFFSSAVPCTTPTHGHFVLSPVSLASRDQDGGPSDSMIDIYDVTEKQGTVNSLLKGHKAIYLCGTFCFLKTLSRLLWFTVIYFGKNT